MPPMFALLQSQIDDILWIATIWLGTAGFAAGVGATRGRGVKAFLFCLRFGPLALLIIVPHALPKPRPQSADPQIPDRK